MIPNLLKIFLPYTLVAGIGVAIYVSCRPPASDPVVIVARQSRVPCAACRQLIHPAESVSAAIDNEVRYFCCDGCRRRYLSGDDQEVASGRMVDVVCHMDVNPAWGYAADYHGALYYFCSQRCRDRFAEQPDHFLGRRCTVCRKPLDSAKSITATYMGNQYEFCTRQHRATFQRDPAAFFMHTMWGVPSWLYYSSIAFVLVISFGIFESAGTLWGKWFRRVQNRSLSAAAAVTTALPLANSDRLDLMRLPGFAFLARSRPFRFAAQLLFVVFFVLIIAAGLFGSQNPGLNIAPILTWTVWWGGLVLLIMFAGKAWCYVCPWDAIATWMEKLRFWRKADEGLGLELPWPKGLRNILVATILFVGLTWVELGFGVTMKPRVTAYLGLAMLIMAIVSAFLFQRKSFCRFGCLVGRVSGLYALFSGIEVRARRRDVCEGCRGKECVQGSPTAYGCPTFLYPGRLAENTYCIQCGECLQACPEDNLAVNLRPWGTDLIQPHRARMDEAQLALLMLSITAFHGLTMTPHWRRLTDWLENDFALSHLVSFSLGMTALMLAPIAIYAVLIWLSYRLVVRTDVGMPITYERYFVRYAYALLPIALFYHLAHNLEHLLMEGPKVVALMSDPFGYGWDMLGTRQWHVPPLVSLEILWLLQIALVLVGHVFSLWVASRTTAHLFSHRRRVVMGQIPLLIGMILFSVFSLWLLKQPMEMRTSAM